jgi:D-alanyl-D-alanine carboxypeptidase (penicillin-binding protein 5/6)
VAVVSDPADAGDGDAPVSRRSGPAGPLARLAGAFVLAATASLVLAGPIPGGLTAAAAPPLTARTSPGRIADSAAATGGPAAQADSTQPAQADSAHPAQPDSAQPAPPAGITANAWLLADARTGAILAARNPHIRDLPASTMKILTALTVLPTLPPDRQVTIGEDAPRVDGSKVGLVPGMRYRVRELATAMLIASGNDATVALVDAAGGTTAVLARMNALARSLGADDTVAGDPTGLDAPGQATSVHDLAVFGRAALESPAVRNYLTIRRASIRGRGGAPFEIQNHNSLLGSYEGTIGVKNGYTIAANATYVGAARRGSRTLIVALLRANPAYGRDARALLDWGFAHDGKIRALGTLPDISERREGAAPPLAPGAAAAPAGNRSGHGRGGIFSAPVGPLTWTAIGLTATAGTFTVLRSHRRRRRRMRLPVQRGDGQRRTRQRRSVRRPPDGLRHRPTPWDGSEDPPSWEDV